MNVRKVWGLYFSATGNTARTVKVIAETLAEQLGVPVELLPFCGPQERARDVFFAADELVVVGTPTYAGKMPNKLLPDFQSRLHGNGALAVPVVTFGNRSYDNALAELCAVLEEDGFYTVAAGAFVGRHAFTDELAYGRPGWSDEMEMKQFAGDIANRVKGFTKVPSPVVVSGDAQAPYYVPKGLDGQPAKFLKAVPKTHLNRCSGCGACTRLCPMGAIDPTDPARVTGICIKCQACVRRCTKQAKYFDDPAFLSHVAMLEKHFEEPRENEVFLPDM